MAGNAGGEWSHQIESNRLWLASVSVAGFSAGAYFPAHPHEIRPAVRAALEVAAAGLAQTEIDVLPLADAVVAHERMECRDLAGRIVLTSKPSR